MSQGLDHQTAIVVGASSGMGRAIASALAQAGAHVVAAARRIERLEELQQQILAKGHSLEVYPVDSTRNEDVEDLISRARKKSGRIDLLIYASGVNIPDRALGVLTDDNWQMLVDTNLTGAFHCTKAVLPVMRAAGNGLIIFLSSACVQSPDVSGVAYQASKHGLVGLAHGTRIEEKSHGIRTSVIFPGLCDTEILTRRPLPTPREILEKSLAPEDIADAVLFLARLPARAVVPELQLIPALL